MISFSAIFVRMSGASPSTAAVFRTGYAVPLLLLIRLLTSEPDPRKRRERILAFVAGCFLGLDLTVWHRSIQYIGAGLATVLGNTQIVFVAILAAILHKEKPTRGAMITIPVVFAGVVLISGLGHADAYGADPFLGVVYGVLTGLTYSAFLLILRRANRDMSPPVGPLLDATAGALLMSLLLAPADSRFSLAITFPEHLWLILLAALAQCAGWLLITRTLPRLPALDTSVMLLLQPMLTVLWSVLIFREALSPLQWLGVALVIGGVAVLSLRGSVVPAEEAL